MCTKISLPITSNAVNIDGGVYLSDYAPKENWDKHRGNTETVGALYGERAQYSRLANRMHSCSLVLEFGETVSTRYGEFKRRLIAAKFCKVRHCPMCQVRRAMRNTAKVFERLPELEAQHPKLRWLFLTLTVKSPPMQDLRATILAMNKAWHRLVVRKDWPAVGWLRAVEVTKGRDGNPHPHFHVLMAVKPSYFSHGYIKQDAWLQLWRDVMRDQSITQVDIRVVKPKEKGGKLGAAVAETLKYAVKPEDLMRDPQFLYGLTEQLHKMRFLACGGLLKGLLKDNPTNDELVAGGEGSGEIDPTRPPVVFNWVRQERRYKSYNLKK